jgi:hypothetical protein
MSEQKEVRVGKMAGFNKEGSLPGLGKTVALHDGAAEATAHKQDAT